MKLILKFRGCKKSSKKIDKDIVCIRKRELLDNKWYYRCINLNKNYIYEITYSSVRAYRKLETWSFLEATIEDT